VNFKFKSIALAIGLSAGSIIAAPSYAVPVQVEVLAQVSATSDGVTNSDSQGPASSANAWASSNNVSGSASGNDSGWSSLTASAYGANNFTVSSKLRQVATVTNDFSSAQNFSFNFLISRGGISTSNLNLTGSDFLNASYSATIMVNGVSIWNTAAQVATTALGSELYKTGTDLGGYESSSYYSWNPFSSSINLGEFDAGETFTLEYTINAFVGGMVSDCEYSSSGYGYGYGYGYGCYHNARAQFGDPFDFNAMNDKTITASPATSVSEPMGGLLLGAGLLGLAFRRRAKK